MQGREGIAEIHTGGFLLVSLLDIMHYRSTAPLGGVTHVGVRRYAQVLLSATASVFFILLLGLVLLVLLHNMSMSILMRYSVYVCAIISSYIVDTVN